MLDLVGISLARPRPLQVEVDRNIEEIRTRLSLPPAAMAQRIGVPGRSQARRLIQGDTPAKRRASLSRRIRPRFRTPQGLASELGELAPAGTIFRNPHQGTGLTMLDATQQLGEAAVFAAEIRRLLVAGHELADLIILELGGLSNLVRFGDRIGEHRLRRFTGHCSDHGEQLLTRGDLDIETIWSASLAKLPGIYDPTWT